MEKDFNEVLKRINELYKKSQEEGLTEEEKKEQAELRKYYIDVFKNNVRNQLKNIKIVTPEELEKQNKEIEVEAEEVKEKDEDSKDN